MSDIIDDKTISKINSGFPAYLDFQKLRSSAIAYLGNLSGNIWTDHNVHDPGITMLENLLYAILDLGYRTNLPVQDILARNPLDTTNDNNFFTPAEILACNPLTIIDYRKMLVDIEGVKNAWLDIEMKAPVVFCSGDVIDVAGDNNEVGNINDPCGCDYLNGLYHVYIQFENNIKSSKHIHDHILKQIKRKLLIHRNLCEDYIDIQELCTLEVGICADIALEINADAGNVYLQMVSVLKEYFSPSPKFYSLQQMLDKNKSIDEIYNGRPLDTKESHGFLDTNELEQLQLRQELHISDIYSLLFKIPGVKGVRNLKWIKCDNQPVTITHWKLSLAQNFVTEFSPDCSVFDFYKNEIPVNIDLKKFSSFLKLNLSDQQKILYPANSEILNAPFPQGGYRNDLSDYYSLSNDFPSTYGIGEGDLASDVSDTRKAQALQLQGFLLFFDQLLVNYLAQLKNIRSLFAFNNVGKEGNQHTYFIQQLSNTPNLNKLLRFNQNADGTSGFGTEGSTLVYPTDRKKLQLFLDTVITTPSNCCDSMEDEFPTIEYCLAAIRDQSVHLLMDDMLSGNFYSGISKTENDHFFFYIFTSSNEFGLVSKMLYASEKEAAMAASSIQYISTFEGNYRNYMITDKDSQRFSFDIVSNIDTYADYLQLIVENKDLNLSRRQDFQKHLMSRFAETFADFALLSSGFMSGDILQEANLQAGANFLNHYPDISSNRGKASDYSSYKWGNSNTSGFEKRFKALAGITNQNRHYLCNFIVERADKLYALTIQLFDKTFNVDNKIFIEEQALVVLKSIFNTLKKPYFEVEYISHENKWQVFLKDPSDIKLSVSDYFEDKNSAALFIQKLNEVTHFEPDLNSDILITKYIHKVLLTNAQGDLIAESNMHFVDKSEAETYGNTVAEKINFHLNVSNDFLIKNRKIKTDKLLKIPSSKESYRFIDEHEFRFKPFDVIHLDKEKKKYSVVNKDASLQFDAIVEFDTLKLARESFRDFLVLLTDPECYKIDRKNVENEEFAIFIENENQRIAIYFESFTSRESASKKLTEILKLITTYTYQLYISEQIADEWEFLYHSADLSGNDFLYKSVGHFISSELVQEAALTFYHHVNDLVINFIENKWAILLELPSTKIACEVQGENINPADIEIAKDVLDKNKEFQRIITNYNEKDLQLILEQSRINPGEDFIYKLVDKDNIRAIHPLQPGIPDETTAQNIRNELIVRAQTGYESTDVSTFGNIVRERIDNSTGITWYHFLIRSVSREYKKGYYKNQKLIYFESVRGYATTDEALQAFDEEYLIILKSGRHLKSYGLDKYISLKEIFIHNTYSFPESKSVVFVPGETVYEFDGLDIPNKLVALSTACPIQYLGKNKYRFQLSRIDETTFKCIIDWRSKQTFITAREAILQYKFFKFLLLYAGNYIIFLDAVLCVFKIGIREVLAISTQGFTTPDEAWGSTGVEKFICTAQSTKGFHTYTNKIDCNSSFYVACNNLGLNHPCIYETPQRRDMVLEKLYKASAFSFFNLINTVSDEFIILTDLNQQPIVKINFPANEIKNKMSKSDINKTHCDWLIIFFQTVFLDDHYKRNKDILHLEYYDAIGKVNFTLAESLVAGVFLKNWKMQLQNIALYFPIKETTVNCGNSDEIRYLVEIRFPGFDGSEPINLDPCNPDDCMITCDIGWKSDCCFESCCEALDFYAQSFELLRVFENYRQVYDCLCGSYRIELLPKLTRKSRELLLKRKGNLNLSVDAICVDVSNDGADKNKDGNFDNLQCFKEIIAINPQYYNDENLACDAVERAKKLINTEGLHLVEHILLRPRCKDDNESYKECSCDALPKPCINVDEACHFEWKPLGQQDPCEAQNNPCFTPGCDPYSFIATLFLPAWTERFREDHNRQFIEKMLQREAPAHILLRIVWLTPQDLCKAENLLVAWNIQLAGNSCKTITAYCDLLRFLFKDQHRSLSDCTECLPCTCEDDNQPCIPESEDACDQISFKDQINNLFCWTNN